MRVITTLYLRRITTLNLRRITTLRFHLSDRQSANSHHTYTFLPSMLSCYITAQYSCRALSHIVLQFGCCFCDCVSVCVCVCVCACIVCGYRTFMVATLGIGFKGLDIWKWGGSWYGRSWFCSLRFFSGAVGHANLKFS